MASIEKNYVNNTTAHVLKMILLILNAKPGSTLKLNKGETLYIAGKTYTADEVKMNIIM